MKLSIKMLAVVSLALLFSCNNTSEKTTTDDTVATTTTQVTDNTDVVMVEPPATIKTSFEAKYPQATNIRWNYHRPDFATVEWDWSGWPVLDTSDYVASYTWDGSEYWSWYDQDGNWVGSVSRVRDYSTLPQAVNNTVTTKYNGYTIVSVDKENDKNRTAYEIQLESGTNKLKLLVDENGKVLKSKTISGDTKTKDKADTKDSVM